MGGIREHVMYSDPWMVFARYRPHAGAGTRYRDAAVIGAPTYARRGSSSPRNSPPSSPQGAWGLDLGLTRPGRVKLSSEGGERRVGRRAPWPRLLPLAVAFMVAVAVADVAAQTPTITLSVSPSSVGEDDGSADVTVTATLGTSRTVATVVTLSLGGTASDPDDYQVLGSLPSITIQSGQTTSTAQVIVSLVDDTLYEGDESIELAGSSSGADVVPASITVQDDETQPTITLTKGDGVALSEASPADTASTTVTATVLGGSTFSRDTTFTFDFDVFLHTPATKGVDFTVTPDPYTVTIPAGATVGTGSATFSVLDDNIFEGFERINAVATGTDHLGNALAFTYPSHPFTALFMGIITDDETAPRISFHNQTQTRLREDDPPQTKTVARSPVRAGDQRPSP